MNDDARGFPPKLNDEQSMKAVHTHAFLKRTEKNMHTVMMMMIVYRYNLWGKHISSLLSSDRCRAFLCGFCMGCMCVRLILWSVPTTGFWVRIPRHCTSLSTLYILSFYVLNKDSCSSLSGIPLGLAGETLI